MGMGREMIRTNCIPDSLKSLPQWVAWRTTSRNGTDKPTKIPFSPNGDGFAKANDPATWDTFAAALAAFDRGNFDGVGFEFAETDPYCGVDLDGCRNPETGEVAAWAKEIILELSTYAEVSPSLTGVKLFAVGKLPFRGGRKLDMPDMPRVCEKMPAVEVYDHKRYFAVTGHRLQGQAHEPQNRQNKIVALCNRFWPDAPQQSVDWHSESAVVERARKYVAKLPPAISGQSGHNATFRTACVLVLGFGLNQDEALRVLGEWNLTCQPPWSEHELQHKIASAAKQSGERNYLRLAKPESWERISVPNYEPPKEKLRPRTSTISSAMDEYLERKIAGEGELVETGIPELDYALGGGVTFGELLVIAGRPSHGKSVCGLQCAHAWTSAMLPTLFITEEMSRMQLGRRSLLFASGVTEERWLHDHVELKQDIDEYRRMRAECFIVESCQTMEVATEEVERHIAEHSIRAIVLDYAQLLQSKGKQRWEQMANTSESLRRIASRHQIIVCALVQMNQEIEKRDKFQPKMSDLGDTGQWARDADVIVAAVWPHRFDHTLPANEYKLYTMKNRNRPINAPVVTCRFEPMRQRIVESRAKDARNYEPAFDEWQYADPE